MIKKKNLCKDCVIKQDFDKALEWELQKWEVFLCRQTTEQRKTIAWLNSEIDAINKRLRAAAESVGILRWIQDDFIKWGEAPEQAIERIQGLDSEYRKTLFSTYAHALEDVVRALDPERKTALHTDATTEETRNGETGPIQ